MCPYSELHKRQSQRCDNEVTDSFPSEDLLVNAGNSLSAINLTETQAHTDSRLPITLMTQQWRHSVALNNSSSRRGWMCAFDNGSDTLTLTQTHGRDAICCVTEHTDSFTAKSSRTPAAGPALGHSSTSQMREKKYIWKVKTNFRRWCLYLFTMDITTTVRW